MRYGAQRLALLRSIRNYSRNCLFHWCSLRLRRTKFDYSIIPFNPSFLQSFIPSFLHSFNPSILQLFISKCIYGLHTHRFPGRYHSRYSSGDDKYGQRCNCNIKINSGVQEHLCIGPRSFEQVIDQFQ